MTDENYTVIQGWMITQLHLSGRELILYSLIYGFSQGDNSGYNGSLKYLMEWLESTKKTVITTLSSLVSKGLITKHEETINGVKFCRYVANYTGGVKITPGGGVKITPNNNNKDNNNSLQKESVLTNTKEKVSLTIPEPLKECFAAFVEMRKSLKYPTTDYALKLILGKLEKLAPGDFEQQTAIINQSIECGYRGVFPLKTNHSKHQNDSVPDDFDVVAHTEEMKRMGYL